MNLKQTFILLFFFLSVSFISAQEQIATYSEAINIAKESNKKIVLIFSGSDWCAPCIKLDKQVFATASFKNYAKDNYIMLKADFPKRKKNKLSKEQEKHNNELAEKYNKNGFFPLVVVMNSNGESLGALGYQKLSPEEFIKRINSFK